MRAPWTSRFSDLFFGHDPLFAAPEKKKEGDGLLCLLCVILLLILKFSALSYLHYTGTPLRVAASFDGRGAGVIAAHPRVIFAYHFLFIAVSSTGFVSGITAIIRRTNGAATSPMVFVAYLIIASLWSPYLVLGLVEFLVKPFV